MLYCLCRLCNLLSCSRFGLSMRYDDRPEAVLALYRSNSRQPGLSDAESRRADKTGL